MPRKAVMPAISPGGDRRRNLPVRRGGGVIIHAHSSVSPILISAPSARATTGRLCRTGRGIRSAFQETVHMGFLLSRTPGIFIFRRRKFKHAFAAPRGLSCPGGNRKGKRVATVPSGVVKSKKRRRDHRPYAVHHAARPHRLECAQQASGKNGYTR